MKTPDQIIDALGGTSEVAKLCQVTMPSVSEWRIDGIPKARLMYLKVVRPEVFDLQSPADIAQGVANV
jgi:hypothetical protein